jgi:hypothetical protein
LRLLSGLLLRRLPLLSGWKRLLGFLACALDALLRGVHAPVRHTRHRARHLTGRVAPSEQSEQYDRGQHDERAHDPRAETALVLLRRATASLLDRPAQAIALCARGGAGALLDALRALADTLHALARAFARVAERARSSARQSARCAAPLLGQELRKAARIQVALTGFLADRVHHDGSRQPEQRRCRRSAQAGVACDRIDRAFHLVMAEDSAQEARARLNEARGRLRVRRRLRDAARVDMRVVAAAQCAEQVLRVLFGGRVRGQTGDRYRYRVLDPAPDRALGFARLRTQAFEQRALQHPSCDFRDLLHGHSLLCSGACSAPDAVCVCHR